MKTRTLVTLITFLGIFAMASRFSVDTDTWWHLRAGQWMIQNRALLREDLFSHTRLGSPWEYPGWLAQVPMALIFSQFGSGGLNFWTAGMVTLAFVCIWGILTGSVFLKSFTILIAAAASGVYWSARPHLVTLVFTALFLYILEGSERKHRHDVKLWILPLVMLVWVNSHGGFAAGFLVWGVYWLSAVIRAVLDARNGITRPDHISLTELLSRPEIRLTVIGLMLILVGGINPFGYRTLLYPFKTIGMRALQLFIQEWQSPDFHKAQFMPFMGLLLICMVVLGISRSRAKYSEIILTTGFAAMGLMASRNIALFSLAAPVLLTRHLAASVDALGSRIGLDDRDAKPASAPIKWVNLSLTILFTFVVVLRVILISPAQANAAYFENKLPVHAARMLHDSELEGNLYNSYNWGGYFLWALPEIPVFIDGRTDLYDDEIVGEWLTVYNAGEEWEKILLKYGVRIVFVEINSTIARVLARTPGWDIYYQDAQAIIFYRQ